MRNLNVATSIKIALIFFILFSYFASEVSAQNRRGRRTTTAATPTPTPAPVPEARIISEGQENTATTTSNGTDPGTLESENAALRETVNQLSNQINSLSEKMGKVETTQRTLVDLERLSRAEQRLDSLMSQHRDVLEKEGNLTARLEQINYELQGQNVEYRSLGIGTTRPEQLRDHLKRSLESERIKVKTLLDQTIQGRVKLESSIASAETEVNRLKARVDKLEEKPEAPRSTTVEKKEEPKDKENPYLN
jgi:chromosome segregation ATPase